MLSINSETWIVEGSDIEDDYWSEESNFDNLKEAKEAFGWFKDNYKYAKLVHIVNMHEVVERYKKE